MHNKMENNLSLFELNTRIKNLITDSFRDPFWVVAEINELNINTSGHCYMELVEKDPSSEHIVARARATVWSSTFRILKPYFETTTGRSFSAGIKVLLNARVDFHELYGYSLNIRDIDPNYTLGDMARQRQETINRLQSEGILNMNRELEFPLLPARIALISSQTAAGYEDFLDQLNENPYGYRFEVALFPAIMQGQQAVASITDALDQIYQNESSYDVVVLVRGGGSQTDLGVFDDYSLASHMAQFPLPILTGIGHEKDESVADMVAYRSLKTPTAVAEFFVDAYITLEQHTTDLADQIIHSIKHHLTTQKKRQDGIYMKLTSGIQRIIYDSNLKLNKLHTEFNPALQKHIYLQYRILERYADTCGFVTRNHLNQTIRQLSELHNAARGQALLLLKEKKQLLIMHERTMQLLDPTSILKRGYSITYQNGKAIRDAAELDADKILKTTYSKGYTFSTINKIGSDNS